jgi:trehalose 6-phosphate phosphatase
LTDGSLERLVDRIIALDRPLLLAFDVDGTLAPIVEDPAAARVPRAVRAALESLMAVDGVVMALVTGRDARSLRRMVHIPQAYRALQHGQRLVAPGKKAASRSVGAADRERMQRFVDWATMHAVPLGARLERKPSAVAVHVRALAAKDPALARTVLAKASHVARGEGLHPREGRAVLEAELQPGDKGGALLAIARAVGAKGVVYAGDDLTDVGALEAAVGLGGVGIFVRSKERSPSLVRGCETVAGPQEVGRLLELLVQALDS